MTDGGGNKNKKVVDLVLTFLASVLQDKSRTRCAYSRRHVHGPVQSTHVDDVNFI
jgi:hypothetical protein